jgi:hypothetical protein
MWFGRAPCVGCAAPASPPGRVELEQNSRWPEMEASRTPSGREPNLRRDLRRVSLGSRIIRYRKILQLCRRSRRANSQTF